MPLSVVERNKRANSLVVCLDRTLRLELVLLNKRLYNDAHGLALRSKAWISESLFLVCDFGF